MKPHRANDNCGSAQSWVFVCSHLRGKFGGALSYGRILTIEKGEKAGWRTVIKIIEEERTLPRDSDSRLRVQAVFGSRTPLDVSVTIFRRQSDKEAASMATKIVNRESVNACSPKARPTHTHTRTLVTRSLTTCVLFLSCMLS